MWTILPTLEGTLWPMETFLVVIAGGGGGRGGTAARISL